MEPPFFQIFPRRGEEVEMRLLRDPGPASRDLCVLLLPPHSEDQAAHGGSAGVLGEGDHVHIDVVFILGV